MVYVKCFSAVTNFCWNLRCLVQSNSYLTQVPSCYCKISKHLIETNDYNNSTLSLQAHSHNSFNYWVKSQTNLSFKVTATSLVPLIIPLWIRKQREERIYKGSGLLLQGVGAPLTWLCARRGPAHGWACPGCWGWASPWIRCLLLPACGIGARTSFWELHQNCSSSSSLTLKHGCSHPSHPFPGAIWVLISKCFFTPSGKTLMVPQCILTLRG